MCRISLEAEKLGMSVNVDKTEVQCIGQNQQIINVSINGKKLSQVEDTKQRLRVFEMGCLRRILGVTRRDWIRNVHVRERLNLSTDIVQWVAERRLQFFGHVVRMPAHRLPLVAIQGQVHGKRSRGRPQKRWIDNVKEDVTTMGISLVEAFRLTQDREG